MTFDATGLSIFLLAIFPGFVAQQALHSIVPRSVQKKTAIEETGEYVLNSVFIHLVLLAGFRSLLGLFHPSSVATLVGAADRGHLTQWGWHHGYLMAIYFLLSLIVALVLGFARGVLYLNQPVRKFLLRRERLRRLLVHLGVFSFLLEEPVWYGVLRQGRKDELTFVEVKMKGGGRYAGELKNFAILGDSERDKDFYLVNVHYLGPGEQKYVPLAADGILLNFSDAESVQIRKGNVPVASA